jgi:hypothetical protein
MAKDGWYPTNGTGTHYPSQPFGEMADIMAAVMACLKLMVILILSNSEICCEASRDMVPPV